LARRIFSRLSLPIRVTLFLVVVCALLIGSDVAARLERVGHDEVHILADRMLGGLYVAAIEAHGRRAVLVDSHAAFIAGIIAIGRIS